MKRSFFLALVLFFTLLIAVSANAQNNGTHPVKITDQNFQQLVLNSDDVVLVDFWATWCGPCKRINPIIEKLADKYQTEAVIGKVNVDYNKLITQKYNIKNIPTILIFKNGKLVDKFVGATNFKQLDSKIKKYLK